MTAIPLTLHPLVSSLEIDAIRLDPDGGPRTLGRGHGHDVVVPDPTVSRPHARLEPGERGWTLVHLRSKNGTFVNLMPLGPEESSPVPSGVIVEFGAIAFTAMLGDEEDPLPAFEAPRVTAATAGDAVAAEDLGDADDFATVALDEWRTRIADFAAVDHADVSVRGRGEERLAERCMRLAARYARFARERTGATQEQAEDATHEAVMKLVGAFRRKGGHYFDPARGSFRALFRTVFVRELIRRSQRDGRGVGIDPSDLPVPYEDRAVHRLLIEDELREVLRSLKPRITNERAWLAFELHVLRGLSGPAVMEQLGIEREGTFYSMISRVRGKALEIYEDGSFLPD